MFLIPVIIYLLMLATTSTSYSISAFALTLIVVQAIFFSYLGNVFSLKGIQLSPNPGYSLIISKSYVVFTAVASIFLFDAPLTLKSIVAIGFIIGFSAVIIIEKSKSTHQNNRSWIAYTLGAFFCWGMLALSSKYLLNLGVPILIRLVYSMVIVTLLISGEMFVKKISIKNRSNRQWLALLIIGISGATFNYFMQVAFDSAPNVGFVNAANAGSISLLTLMSALIFKDELTAKKVVGIAGVTLGLLLLFL